MDAIIRIGDTAKVIYIGADISSQDKEKLISNKLIQKRRSKDATERRWRIAIWRGARPVGQICAD